MSALLDSVLDAARMAECAKHEPPPRRQTLEECWLVGITDETARLRIRQLCREYELLRGHVIPEPGCNVSLLPMGSAQVAVEWSLHNGEVCIESAAINGQQLDPARDGWCSDAQLERWAEAIRREINPERGRHMPELRP